MKETKMLVLFGLSFVFLVGAIFIWMNGEKSAASDANQTYQQIQGDIAEMNKKTLRSFEAINETLGVLNATLMNTNQRLTEIDIKHNQRGSATDLDVQRLKEKLDKMHTRAVPTTNNINLKFAEPIPIQVIHSPAANPAAANPKSPAANGGSVSVGTSQVGSTDVTRKRVPSTPTKASAQ